MVLTTLRVIAMPDAQRIDPVLVEKAVEAFEKAPEYPGEGPDTTDRVAMEAAIGVVFDELRLKEERRKVIRQEYTQEGESESRYVSHWRPVEQGDAK
jgi:hypothetical protein